jgi:hypothetical protein
MFIGEVLGINDENSSSQNIIATSSFANEFEQTKL